MANAKMLKVDPARPIELNVVARSPHVLVYRLWHREPDGQWKIAGTGSTDDNAADFYSVGPFPKGTTIAYLFRFGGNERTRFLGILTVAQGGEVVDGGTFVETRLTDDDGLAQVVGSFELA
jgi:hypothetical protein